MKLDYKKTFILGLGFFAISLVWPLYNFYVPLFLKDYISSQTLIGAVMTIDNILAITLIPFIGSWSDRTITKYGRRMPYLMVGIPISAVIFTILPSYNSLTSLMIILFVLNIAMAIYRAPTVALMPDITPPPLRSQANGIINFMGGLAAVFVLMGGAYIYEINRFLPFIITSLLMFFALFMLFKFIKEPKNISVEKKEKISIIESTSEIIRNKDKTTLYILIAIFLWFVGYQGINATFSIYAVEFLGVSKKTGSLMLGCFALTFLIFAIPSGFIAGKFKKRKTIMIGIIGLIITFMLLAFICPTTTFLGLNFKSIMMILLAIGGTFWALININSYPMVVEQTNETKIGTYTGLYYFSSSLAAILGPLIFGIFVDLIGYHTMFYTAAISFVLAFIFIFKTRPKEIISITETQQVN